MNHQLIFTHWPSTTTTNHCKPLDLGNRWTFRVVSRIPSPGRTLEALVSDQLLLFVMFPSHRMFQLISSEFVINMFPIMQQLGIPKYSQCSCWAWLFSWLRPQGSQHINPHQSIRWQHRRRVSKTNSHQPHLLYSGAPYGSTHLKHLGAWSTCTCLGPELKGFITFLRWWIYDLTEPINAEW